MRISDWSSDVCSSDLPKIGDQPVYDLAKLEQGVAGIVRNWHDEVRDALVKQRGEHEGVVLANRYARSLPAGYVEDVSRTEERRVGKEGGRTCRSWGAS